MQMANDLENLIRQTEADINKTQVIKKGKSREGRGKMPKLSVAMSIWLFAILAAVYGFNDIVSVVFKPAESKIEQDLTQVLTSAASSLRKYQHESGTLPPMLPNPAIRGLVKYEPRNEFSFVLSASIGDVTMVLESDKGNVHRKEYE